MSRSSRSSSRKLVAETLEPRRLLAGDACGMEQMQSFSVANATFATDPILPAESELHAASDYNAFDAGSTLATAADVGSVDGTVRLAGRLNRWDRIDTIRFTVDRDAEVRVNLSRMNRNADLYLRDEAGNLLGQSIRAGRRTERIAASLDAGDYFISVVAATTRSTRYRLSISAQLQPETDPAPPLTTPQPITPPPAAEPPITSPTPTPVTETPTTGSPTTTPATEPQPLADVPYFGGSREWNINAVGAPEAWAAGYTGQGITVAVVDTGVDLDHPDLVGNLFVNPGEIAGNGVDDDGNGFIDDVHGYDFAGRDADANDVGGHGTHVAGTIAAANNGIGATGVAPNAKILPVRVLGANGSGSTLDVAAGIRYAANLGADIINLSLGGGYSRAIESAIDYARGLGSFIVAAAGNESANQPGYPARFSATKDNVISVGAYHSSGRLAGFSNTVGASGAIQVDAPGVGIYSTYVGGGYATLSGTSMAAPHVAGLAALTLSSNPNLTSHELRDLLASGTIGTARTSDAIGKANSANTIAFAAAGIVNSTVSSRASSSLLASSLAGSRRIGTTQIVDATISAETEINATSTDLVGLQTYGIESSDDSQKQSAVPDAISDVAVRREAAVDEVFANYPSDDKPSDALLDFEHLV